MAFPVPKHLPWRPVQVDVSSQILNKIDLATNHTINSSLAQEWIGELHQSIQSTKLQIHERIQSELPKFQQQLETSKSVKARYDVLSTSVDGLEDTLWNPQAGILPTLLNTLTKNSTLAQDTINAETLYQAFLALRECRSVYISLKSSAEAGQLPGAVRLIESLESLVENVPVFIRQTQVMMDLKQKLDATNARIQDQLSDAYSKSIILSPTEILIHPEVQVRRSEAIVQLPALLHSLHPTSLINHLLTLQRDIMSYFVNHVLKQPYSVLIQTSSKAMQLSLIPAPPSNEDPSKRLDNLSAILTFLFDHLFLHFPPHDAVRFMHSLSKPVANSVLNNLLVPSLPSSFGLLPSFLKLIKQAVAFEEKDIGRLLAKQQNEGTIKAWSDEISGHYERRRRIDILDQTRKEILAPEDGTDTFQAVSNGGLETSLPAVIPVQTEVDDAWSFDEPTSANPAENTWNFDEALTPNAPDNDADSWGFDEPMPAEDTAGSWGLDNDIGLQSHSGPTAGLRPRLEEESSEKDPDPEDAWEWKDESDMPTEEIHEENAWDDPWAESAESMPVALESPPAPPPSQTTPMTSPKAATGLEKKLFKNKKQLNGHLSVSNSPLSSPPVPELSEMAMSFSSSIKPEPPEDRVIKQAGRHNPEKRPADVVTSYVPKEYYLVPKRTKRVVKMVETVIDESKLFYASNLFADKDLVPAPGSILSQSASSILDLYQAVYPITHAKELEQPDKGMLFSNSCLYMTSAIQRIEDTLYGQSIVKDRLAECRHHLEVLGDSWFDKTIERQQQEMDKVLTGGAQGFVCTGDQDRYDECEAAVNSVLQSIKRLAWLLKGILTKTKYYNAIGLVATAALSRMLQGILALPDIPELESHRLSELCRIFNALEGLFIDDSEQPSFVAVFVPNWFKFSYLSELLEASLADTTYLFEQGALVDFHVDELVNLVRALFSDTLLRTNTINKLLNGHPTLSH